MDCSPHSAASARQSASSSPANEGDTAVAAITRSVPSVSCATHVRKAESAPPLNATITSPMSRKRSRKTSSSGIHDLDPDALVALALRLGLDHADAADLVCRAHMRAAVGLLVETDD